MDNINTIAETESFRGLVSERSETNSRKKFYIGLAIALALVAIATGVTLYFMLRN